MEIPAIKIEQYERNSQLFAQELGQALENVGVAQVNGLEQQLVDELYQNAEDVFEQCKREYLHSFEFESWAGRERLILNDHRRDITYLHHFPSFKLLTDHTYSNLNLIGRKLLKALEIYVDKRLPLKNEDFYLFRYLNTVDLGRTKIMQTNQHDKPIAEDLVLLYERIDHDYITLAPRATRAGLEGFKNNKWVLYSQNQEMFLFFQGNELLTEK